MNSFLHLFGKYDRIVCGPDSPVHSASKTISCMHFEILVEDASGKLMLEQIVPKILGPKGKPHKYRIINIQELKHRVMMQRSPRDRKKLLPWDTILLQTLTSQLAAYGRSFYKKNSVVIVIVDLDYHQRETFQQTLERCFVGHRPSPDGAVCLAVEEGEAWLLGDLSAVRHAYPLAKEYVLSSYEQDSICGTWEFLADAIFRGGSERLTELGYPHIGREKCKWAESIGQYVDVDRNRSPSFINFRDVLRRLMLKPLVDEYAEDVD